MSAVASGEMSQDIDRFSVSNEFRYCQSVANAGSRKLREYGRLVDCNDEMDDCYKMVLMCLLHGEKRSKSRGKRKSMDYDDECSMGALTDSQYESFLNDLKEHGESYVLQCERDGSTVVYGYENNSHLAKECNPESRTSSMVTSQQVANLNQTGGVGNQCEQGQKGDLVEKISKWTQKNLIHENEKLEKTKRSPKDNIQVKESLTFHKSAIDKDKPDVCAVNCNTAANEKIRGFNGGNKGRKRKFSRALEPEMECSDQMPGGKNQHKHNPQQTSVEKVNDAIPTKSSTNQGKMSVDIRSSPKHMLPFQEIECSAADKMPHGKNQCKHNTRQTTVEKVNAVIPRKESTSQDKMSEDIRNSPKCMAPFQEIECADQMPHGENQRKHNPQQASVKKVNDVIPRKPSTRRAKMSEDVISTENCMVPVRVIECSDKTRNDDDTVEKITGFLTNKMTMAKTFSKNVRFEDNINVPNVHTRVNQNKHRLDSQKQQDTQELRGDARLEVGLSNEISGAKNRHGHDLYPASVMKSKSSTMRSRNKAQCTDIVKCSYDEYMGVRAAERSVRMENEDEVTSNVKILENKKPTAERSVKMEIEDEMASDAKVLDNKTPAAERSIGMESDNEMTSDVNMLGNKKPATLLEQDEFRKQVLDFLKRPFDKEEYIRYQEAARAGSYYSYYGDVEQKLKKYAHNQRKRLTIYRAFFFWLENVSHPGAFKPWKEREFLAVEPGSAENLSVPCSGMSNDDEL